MSNTGPNHADTDHTNTPPNREQQATNLKDLPRFFATGNLAGTHGAVIALLEEMVVRHAHGDWGDLDEADKQQNLLGIVYGTYILSTYMLPHTGVRIWVITEGDRSLTTVLLPDEYRNPKSWWSP